MDSAGALTAVVTPSGDTPTPAGCCATDVEVTAPLVGEVDGAVEAGFGSVGDEHPERIPRVAITRTGPVALRARREYLRIPSI